MQQKLQQKQSQSLVMTQQLQQSIKLLQLSSQELNDFVDQEIEKNPLLNRAEGEEVETPAEEAPTESAQETLDSNYGDGWQHEASYGGTRGKGETSQSHGGGASGDWLEQTVAVMVTLREHLEKQMLVEINDPAERMIAAQLIDRVDEGGYLREGQKELAELLGAPEQVIEAVVQKLQKLEPTGVFARDLTECLALQLREQNLLDPMMECMLKNLHLMERGDVAGLQKACGADAEDFADMLAQLRSLDPQPARQFAPDLAQSVVPDVFVRRARDGGWQVELNSDALPDVLMDKQYLVELDAQAREKDDKKYLSEQAGQASWLIKAIDQRANTIVKVTAAIVKRQEKFFLYGIQFLKPMTLKDIAADVEMHESTISRVTTNKYMAGPRGTLELKYFFSSTISAASGGNDVSGKTVMYFIKELIDQEDPTKILSDDALVKLLKNKNVDVARRTVAKYREGMNIPSSVIRRRQKKMAG